MSEHQTVFLSTADFFLLQGLNPPSSNVRDLLVTMLRRKLDAAIVTFPADIGPDVVTTGSKVRYRTDGVRTEERTLVAGPNELADGLSLDLTSTRGMALLGLSVGHSVDIPQGDGTCETLLVEEVSRPEASSGGPPELPTRILPFRIRQQIRAPHVGLVGHGDDPGPSAA